MLSASEGLGLFLGYGVLIIGLVLYNSRSRRGFTDFLLMNRNLGVVQGSLSMAVSWIWAPAVFIVSLQAFTQGLPGVFWFTVPNILTFFVFAVFAVRMRQELPTGYTILDVFRFKFPNTPAAHWGAMVVAFGYQLGAVIINCVAGATLINLLSGIPFHIGVLLMAGLALSYSLISGLRASVISDVAQMLMILVIAIIIVPWVVSASGGLQFLSTGLGGASGEYTNLFDPGVAYAFGIATTLGLLAGPVADQMFSQRAFAAKRDQLVRIFVFGGLIFGVVPIVLSILGFVGAAAEREGLIAVADAQMVGPEVVAYYLPKWALALFAVMAFAGLTSTLDSAFTALGSLSARNVAIDDEDRSGREIKQARLGMAAFAIVGIIVALMQPQLLWVFLIYGALASALFLPAFLTLFWSRMTGLGAAVGIFGGFLIGTPLSIYANVSGESDLIVLAAVLSIVVSGVLAVAISLISKEEAHQPTA